MHLARYGALLLLLAASAMLSGGSCSPSDTRGCMLQSSLPGMSAPAEQQAAAVVGLLGRLLPKHAHLFNITIQPPPVAASAAEQPPAAWFKVHSSDGKLLSVKASSGVEAAAGVHWLLKEVCGGSVTWAATGGVQLPAGSLSPEQLRRFAEAGPLQRTRSVPLQYYLNAVTPSYSMAWWGWERWEQEIDWMALQGINLPLAPTGQEYVWTRVFARYGVEVEELEDFFAGPGFAAWQRMGNIQGYGGPLPLGFMERQAEVQRRVLQRMRAFGMSPVLPAFAGFVPQAFVRKQPATSYSRASCWGGFPEAMCCPFMLHPLDPLFQELGAAFIREQHAVYGLEPGGNWYAADVFNEMRPASADPEYLAAVSAAVYKGMAAGDPQATWLMQAWLFFSDQAFWGPDEIRALLNGVPRGRLVLLDLFAEAQPQWNRTDSFYGVPFIWVMLQNFGGNSDMYGSLSAVVEGFSQALASGSSVVGLGTAPEGIEQNPVVFDLVNELPFRSEPPDLAAWFDGYAARRYGPGAPPQAAQAWQLLRQSVYDCRDGHVNTVMDIPVSRPGMNRAEIGLWGLHPHLWYHPSQPLAAWRLLAGCGGALGQLPGFAYDLVDLGRNVLSKHSTQLWWDVVVGHFNKDAAQVSSSGSKLLGLLDDLDTLLATHPGFMLGPRMAQARAAGGGSSQEEQLCERNLRAQLTHWGTSHSGDSEIHDYANKMWAGLVGGYYRERWRQWLCQLVRELEDGRPYDALGWRNATVRHTLEWAQETGTPFPEEPQGDPVALSLALLQKYFPQEQQPEAEEQQAVAHRQQAAAQEQQAVGQGGQQAGQQAGQGAVQNVEVAMADAEIESGTAAAGPLPAAAAATTGAPALECGSGAGGMVLGSGCIIWQQAGGEAAVS